LHIQLPVHMGYNTFMRERTDVLRLLRVAALLWLAYLGLSAAIDFTLKSPGRVQEYFYLTSALIALFFLGVTFWPGLQQRLGRLFLPLVIVLICALPAAAYQVAVRYIFPNLAAPPEALLSRVVPFVLIALILVAWQYRWHYVLLFCLAVALLNVGILLDFVSAPPDLSSGLFAILTQVMSFLVVGLFINLLVGWLHRERRALEEANAKLAHYAQTLEDLAVSRERTRLAQELHDTLSHTLSGLSVQLETMRAYWEVDPAVAKGVLGKSLAATRAGLEETRRALMNLRARPLEELGLAGAVRQAAGEAAKQAGLTLDLVLAGELPPLPPAAEQCVFRVAQEAIANVARHARAHRLAVRLEAQGERAVLTVQDDGIGFDANDSGQGQFGLLGMKERAQCCGGILDITSQAGRGTSVRLTL
jgi:signal transduction histidine kinase